MIGADLAPLELAGRLALAVGLAAFIGLAFEEVYKREERSAPGGVRTFPMLALSGAMLYLIEPHQALAFVVGLIALAVWLHASLRNALPGPNTTTLMIPVSNLVAYVLGPVALTQPAWVVVAVSVTAVLLLGTREQLHGLIRVVPQDELLTAGKFLILVGIILPLVPNQPLTAATPLTPYHVWLAVVAVCTLSYISYLLQKYAPVPNATLLPAILGGIYSSTATTIVLAKRQREAPAVRSDLAAGIVTATAMMYLRLEVIIAVFNWRFAWALAPAMGTLFAFGAAFAIYEWRRNAKRQSDWSLQIPAINPLQIPAAMTFAAIFVVISIISAAIRDAFGQTGILTFAALVGVTDIDPFVINIAQGGVADLSISALCAAILIAASSNNVAKAIYALGFGGVESLRRPAHFGNAGVCRRGCLRPAARVNGAVGIMDFRKKFLVPPGSKIKLADIDPAFTGKHASHETAMPEIARHVESLAKLQYKLYAESKRSLLIVLQGLDAAGKDGVIRHVISGTNPQGVSVTRLKRQSGAAIRQLDGPIGRLGVAHPSVVEHVGIVRTIPSKIPTNRLDTNRSLRTAANRSMQQMPVVTGLFGLQRTNANGGEHEVVPLAGLTCASITKGLDCQTALRGSIGPQRISGAVSNHHQRRRPESPQNQIYVVPQNQAQAMSANTESKTAPKVINGRIDGKFAPGFSGNPGGSPEATRRAFNKRFLLDLAEDWQQHGREVFKRVRRESPAAYLKVCAMLVPREMKLEHSGGIKAMSTEQIERSIELIKEMLAEREAGANAKVIEGEAMPSLPAPTAVNAKSS